MQRFSKISQTLVVVFFSLLSSDCAPQYSQNPSGPNSFSLTSVQTDELHPVTSDKAVAKELSRLLAHSGRLGLVSDRPSRELLKQFYKDNSHRPVWLTGMGFNWRGAAIINELRRADQFGLDARNFRIPNLTFTANGLAQAELALSVTILRYAYHAKGWRIDPRQLNSNIDRGPRPFDAKRVLQSISTANAPGLYMRALHPKHPQFEMLRQKLIVLMSSSSKQAAVQRVLVNMERWRWMPQELGAYHIRVNIPDFRMRVVNHGKIIHVANVVVGKVTNQTPVFSDQMEYLAFYPYWNVPNSIKTSEIIPQLRRGKDIIRKENLRVRIGGRDVDPYRIDWRRADAQKYEFYQPPGEKNVLGYVKFMFPNKHSVYLHDTTSKRLFKRDVRLYSHGCIRLQNPARLAEILLNKDKGWPRSYVDQLIQGRVNHRVDLARTIPVHVTYFTAWVDGGGKLKLHDDYYGHDRLIVGHLTGKSHLIPAPRFKLAAKKNVSAAGYGNSQPGFNDWIQNIFGF